MTFALVETLSSNGLFETRLCETDDGERVVLKRFDRPDTSDRERIRRRTEALLGLKHDGLATCRGVVEDENSISLIYDWVEGRTVMAEIEAGQRWTEPELFDFLLQVMQALNVGHCADAPVVHRDVKPQNVVHADGRFIVIDFDAAREFHDTSGNVSVMGTTGYAGPEQFLGSASSASDQYGAAATAVHMASHRHPTEFPLRNLRLDISDLTVSDALKSVLNRMLDPDPRKRFSSTDEAIDAIRAGTALKRWESALVPLKELDSIVEYRSGHDLVEFKISRRNPPYKAIAFLLISTALPFLVWFIFLPNTTIVWAVVLAIFIVVGLFPVSVERIRAFRKSTITITPKELTVSQSGLLNRRREFRLEEVCIEQQADWLKNRVADYRLNETETLKIHDRVSEVFIDGGMVPLEAEHLKRAIEHAMAQFAEDDE